MTRAELLEQAKEQGLDVKTKTTKAELESMLGETKDEKDVPFDRVYNQPVEKADFLNTDTNSNEWESEKVKKLEDTLSDKDKNIVARVTTSAGNYVRVKFFHDNKPMGTYKSRDFKESEVKSFLKDLVEDRDV